MAESQANRRDCLFMTLEIRSEAGTEQLVVVKPPLPKKPTIPRSRTRNTFKRIGRNVDNANRTPRPPGEFSSGAQIDSSGQDDDALDRQISIGSVMRAVPTSESSAIPITVEGVFASPQQPNEPVQPSHVSTSFELSIAQPSVANMAAFGGNHLVANSHVWTTPSGGLEPEIPISNGQQSPQTKDYDFLTSRNSVDRNLFPHHQSDYGQNVIDSRYHPGVAEASQSWFSRNSENQAASSAHQIPNSAQLTATSANAVCAHACDAYEIVIRCTLCGCYFPLDALQGGSGSALDNQEAHIESQPPGNADLGFAGEAIQTSHYQASSTTNDFTSWTQSRNAMLSFPRLSSSEPAVEPRGLTVDVSTWQCRPPPNMAPTRLSIPDYAYHREPPSAVSASTSSTGSSELYPTPASEMHQDFVFPRIDDLNFDPLIFT